MPNVFKALADICAKLYFLTAPYSRRKPILVLATTLFQGLFQVIGVTSIFPFLAIAADPSGFRTSQLGATILSHLPEISDGTLLVWTGLFSISMLIAANITNLLSDYARARYGQDLAHYLRLRLLSRIVSQPWGYFLQNNTGILLKKANGDVMAMTVGVLFPALEGLSRLVTLLFLAVTLIAIDPMIAVSALLVLLFYYATILSYLRLRYKRASEDQKVAHRGTMQEAQQVLSGIKTIKIQQAENTFLQRYSKHSLTQAQVNAKLPIFYHAPKYILEPIAFGGIVAVIVVQAGLGHDFKAMLPALGVIGLAGYRMLPAAQILYGQISQIATSRHHLEEICDEFDIYNQVQETDFNFAAPATKPYEWRDQIQLDQISFAYPGSKNPVLENFLLTIPRKTSVGIVGPTGSGKSTLVDLILGLHQPTSGRIRVDGQPLESEHIRAWQAGIGYVPQDVFLTDDTLARNIAMGVPDDQIDPDRLREVASAARILDFIENELNDGFESTVGERGIRLSGGQRQRIAIARALYHRPGLLILDEATSALDNATEAAVTEAIASLQGSVTMIVVAHRLSTIERCDRIVDLSKEAPLSPS